MLYKKPETGDIIAEPEPLGINHIVAILLLILVTLIAVSSPDILYQNISDIVKSLGVKI
jgi:hypothetical protein